MILDDQSIEQSASYALGLLEPEELESFEHELRVNPDLEECTLQFRDLSVAVGVAAGAPLQSPPVNVLTGALARIGVGGAKPERPASVGDRFAFFRTMPGLVTAIAASLVLFGGGLTVWHNVSGISDDKDQLADGPGSAGSGDKIYITRDGETVATLDADERTVRELMAKLNRIQRLRATSGVIQDVGRLQKELQALRKADSDRFASNPRVSRSVTIRMVPPGADPASEEDAALADELFDYLTEKIGGGKGVGGSVDDGVAEVGETDPIVPDDVILEGNETGLVVPDINELNGGGLYYRDFPSRADHHEPIDDGRVLDKANNLIWVETDQPGIYQAVAPPANFDPDFVEDYVGQIPERGSLPGPAPSEATPEMSPEEVVESEPVVPASDDPGVDFISEPEPPTAVSYYEQTTGHGSILVGNLPPAGDGQVYQLWMRNLADDRVVNVGSLPDFETGTESFDFDLHEPGITPAGFFLTLEPEGEVRQPGDNIVLQGP